MEMVRDGCFEVGGYVDVWKNSASRAVVAPPITLRWWGNYPALAG